MEFTNTSGSRSDDHQTYGAILCALFSVALSVVMHYATPFSLDETGSWGISNNGAITAIKTCIYAQGQGPLYFVILSLWLRLFGESVFVLRALSILLYSLGVYFFVQTMRRISTHRWITYASAVVWLLSPMSLYYSVLARPYALAITLISLGVWLTTFGDDSIKRRLLLGMVGAAMFYTHYLFIPPLLIMCGILAMSGTRQTTQSQRSLTRGVSVVLVITTGVLFAAAPVAASFFRHLHSVSDIRFSKDALVEDIILALEALPLIPFGGALLLCISHQKGGIAREAGENGLQEFAFAILMPVGLYLASHIMNATLLAPQYYGVALPFTLLFWIKAGGALAPSRPRIVALLFLLQACWGLFGVQYLKDPVRRAFLTPPNHTNLITPPQRFSHCGLFLSTGFIESVVPQRMHNPLLQSFLRAPIAYHFRGDFNLLPLGLVGRDNGAEFISSIQDAISSHGCALLSLSKGWYNLNEMVTPAIEAFPPLLKQAGLTAEPVDEQPWNLLVRDGLPPL